jgi:3-dehydroquinate synthase
VTDLTVQGSSTGARTTSSPAGVHDVRVRAGEGQADYSVLVGRGLLAQLPDLLRPRVSAHRWFVIADQTVADLYGAALLERLRHTGYGADLLAFPAGERSKSRETWSALTDSMLGAGGGRDSGVIALGGGVTGDLAGFVAATFLRGVPVVQAPTSLLAMIDSSVGGKTGVDTVHGKNLVGAFHPPVVVVADTDTVATLPRAERAQGLVEAVKHGAILDEPYLARLERDSARLLEGDAEVTEPAVVRSVEIKASVVSRDEREGDYRQILNFGHTIGQAIEGASGYQLPHGSAVAMGMVLESTLGEKLGVTEPGTSERVARAVEGLGLPSTPPAGTDVRAVLAFMGSDKKRKEGRVRCVLLRAPGQVRFEGSWSQAVDVEDVRSVLEAALDD